MLSFKVSEPTHKKISGVTKYLCYIGYLGGLVFFGYTMVNNYLQAAEILSDPVIVDAAVKLEDVTVEQGRKGRSKETYHFTYSYAAGAQTYDQSFTTSESNADQYLNNETVQIAYAKANPGLSGKLLQLQKNHSMGSILWRFALAFLLLMFLVYAVYMIITAKLFVNKDRITDET